MTTEKTITIHHEAPPHTMDGDTLIMAYWPGAESYELRTANEVSEHWTIIYTAWYDPQVGEPVKPRRYVVREKEYDWDQYSIDDLNASAGLRGVAFNIPTLSAAQAIADIYERAVGGGEA